MPRPKRNPFDDEKEQREKARNKFYAQKREKMLRRRLGLTRHNQQIVIRELNMALIGSPEILRERWCHVSRLDDYGSRVSRGRTYSFAVLRYTLRSEDGRTWTALQAQCHDANRGYMLNVTGFWSLTPA